jgi:leukotriene-A4 hydrolase
LPSILAGDKSLANVIAHEISHSWSGNLVTMSSWKDFWLNEGFTVFIERKIAEMLIDEDMSKLQAIFGYRAMINDIFNLGESKTFSSLNPYLIGRHPDEAFSEVSYEKGFNFIYRTQNIVNKYANFDLFKLILKKYFSKFKYQAIESKKWKEHLYNCINETFNQSIYNNIIKEIDFDYWVKTPGVPKYKNDFNNSYAADADKYVNDFFDKKYDKSFNGTFSKWHTNKKLYYLLQIHTNEKGVDDEGLKYLGETLNLKEGYNSEINNEFFKIMLDNKKLTYIEELKGFLGKFGRMKFLRPLYRGWGSIDKASAYTCFEDNKYWYHPIAVRLIEMDFKKLK